LLFIKETEFAWSVFEVNTLHFVVPCDKQGLRSPNEQNRPKAAAWGKIQSRRPRAGGGAGVGLPLPQQVGSGEK